MKKLWNDIVAILKAPFVGQVDLIQLFLLTGIVIVFAGLWFVMLHNMRHIASEVEV